MAVIQTKRNQVFIHGPDAGHDVFVVTMIAPGDGSNMYRRLSVQPISQWQSAVDWAVGIADQMAHPLRVAAIGVDCFMRFYGDQCARELAAMPASEQAELLGQITTTCEEALRYCPDLDVRADAQAVLDRLGAMQ